jgi:hypothetical protein
LSITGAIGGCCLAYIGPGLAYLGVNGDAFLEWMVSIVIHNTRQQHYSVPTTTTGPDELPLEGDSTAHTMHFSIPSSSAMQGTTTASLSPQQQLAMHVGRPWWWYLTLMPLWIKVAIYGSKGIHDRLAAFDDEDQYVRPVSPLPLQEEYRDNNTDTTNNNNNNNNIDNLTGGTMKMMIPTMTTTTTNEIIPPCKRDFIFSMFFIFFGIIAMVAGVVSNVYVTVQGIFYTPT